MTTARPDGPPEVPAGRTHPPVVEVACDESGSEGERMIGGNTDVFAHASVALSRAAAAECVEGMRERAPSPALEYKAHLILRMKHRHALHWLLGSEGPLGDQARVYLVDKSYLVVRTLVELAVEGPEHLIRPGGGHGARATARALYAGGRRALDPEQWLAFLQAANDVLRVRDGGVTRTPDESVEPFLSTVRHLAERVGDEPTRDTLHLLAAARPQVTAYRQHVHQHPTMPSPLSLLDRGLFRAVTHWAGEDAVVAVTHDDQNLFTEESVTRVGELLGAPPGADPPAPGVSRLAGLGLTDSRSDPRVQVADVLAGVARKIASDELNRRADPRLTALLRPFVDPRSLWGDQPSGAALGCPAG